MKVKKFTGKNIQEIYQQIKLEMGKDAVILHTKKQKKGGFFGFFAKDYYDVTAAVEEFEYDDDEIIEKKHEEKEPEKNTLNQQINVKLEDEKKESETEIETVEKSNTDITEMQKKMDEMMSLIESGNTVFKGEFKEIYDRLTDQEVDPKIASRMVKRM